MATTKSSKTKAQPAIETKKDKLVRLLHQQGGVSVMELSEALGWLPHTVRAMLTGLRKRGITIVKDKVDGATRYSIAAEPQQ